MLISEDYRQQNEKLHETDPSYGISAAKYSDLVKQVAKDFECKTILDYGCGKQTLKSSLPEFKITGFDPAISEIRQTPLAHDLVYCGDVLEHVEPDSLGFVLTDLKRCTKKVIIIVANGAPAGKHLPDGRNAHLIQKPMYWWAERISEKFKILAYTSRRNDFIFIAKRLEDGLRRWDWLYGLCQDNGWTNGAELGVHTGRTSLFLALRGISMISVDLWEPRPEMKDVPGGQTYETWDMEKVYADFSRAAKKLPINILRMSTFEASKQIASKSLDFVFVDADHSYEGAKSDIEHWIPKIKDGGMICGHDYNWPTVRKAVDERFSKIITGYDNCWGAWFM